MRDAEELGRNVVTHPRCVKKWGFAGGQVCSSLRPDFAGAENEMAGRDEFGWRAF